MVGSENLSEPGNGSYSMLHRYPTLVRVYAHFDPTILLIDRTATPFWYALGLFGNLLSAYVWMKPRVRRNNSSAVYLAALSVWDLAFLALHPFQELREAWDIVLENVLVCSVIPVVLLTAQYLSPVLVLCFTLERWIAICFPFRRDSLCTPRRASFVTAAMVAAVTAWNLVLLFFKHYSFGDGQCISNTTNSLWTAYAVTTEMIFSGLVPTTALVFNLLVVRELRQITAGSKRLIPVVGGGGGGGGTGVDDSVERRFRSTTVMLVCVSFFVILTSLPAGLMYALQDNHSYGNDSLSDDQVLTDSKWQNYFLMMRVKKIIDEVSISHYSLNFLIYLLTGPQYRVHARELLARMLQWAGGCLRCLDQARQRKEKQREREIYYLSNSSTDRAKRLARQRGGRDLPGEPTPPQPPAPPPQAPNRAAGQSDAFLLPLTDDSP